MARAELDAAIASWQQGTARLLELVRAVPPEAWERPSGNEGWTNIELLAHLATGYGTRIGTLRAVIDTAPAPVGDVDAENAAGVEQWRRAPAPSIIEEMVRARRQVLTLLHALRNEHLEATVALRGGPRLGDALAHLSEHDLEHAAELRP